MASEDGVTLLVKAQANPDLSIAVLSSVVRIALLSLAQQLKQNNRHNIIIIIITRGIKTRHRPEAQRRCQPRHTLRYAILKKVGNAHPVLSTLPRTSKVKNTKVFDASLCRIKQERLCAPSSQKRGARRVTTGSSFWTCPPGRAWRPWGRLCPSRRRPPRG